MMRLGSVVRDLALVCLAVAVGWWWRGAGTTVLAQKSSSSAGDASLSFQFDGGSPQQSLAVYNPGNRTIYVYPRVGVGNSSINCEYSLTIAKPGTPIRRENCPVGEQAPSR